MHESVRILGVSVILLIVSFAAWVRPLGASQLQLLNGSEAANAGKHQFAALLLLGAVGLSAVAATLAITGWFAT
jgi:hypothetical protein